MAGLRERAEVAGRSTPDLWIAAWAVQHNASLVTRNAKRVGGIPGLELIL